MPRWIDFEDLDLDFLTFGQDVADLFNALVAHFGNVDEAVLAAHEVHERAEIDHVDDLAVIDLADFCFFDDAEKSTYEQLRSARCRTTKS